MMQRLRQLPGTVWLIGLISLLNDSASDMIYPLLPLYLSSVLLAGPRAMGLIEGVAEATSSLLKLVSGVWMDKVRRARPFILVGYALAGFGRPLILLVSSWPGLLLIRFADRVGKGLRSSPRDALLAASVGPGQRGLAFGLHRALDNAGAVVGPLLAALLLGLGFSLQSLFLFTLLPALACLGLALVLREPPRPLVLPAAPAFDWSWRALPIALRRYLLVVALFSLGNASNLFLLLRARELGLSQAEVPLAWAGVSAIAMLASTPLSALSDRLGRRRLILGGWLAYGLFYLVLGLLGSGATWSLYGLFAFYGLFMAATEGVEKALVADLARPEALGTAYGWFNLVGGLLLLPASLLFGSLYEGVGPALAFGVAAGCALGAAALLWLWVPLPLPARTQNA